MDSDHSAAMLNAQRMARKTFRAVHYASRTTRRITRPPPLGHAAQRMAEKTFHAIRYASRILAGPLQGDSNTRSLRSSRASHIQACPTTLMASTKPTQRTLTNKRPPDALEQNESDECGLIVTKCSVQRNLDVCAQRRHEARARNISPLARQSPR
ncbi:hypothetical protein A0H81_05610 [Grifola frondosa]|uniref:Uncharacterized protein n=1 Tax=Grifola frondosa TaxID=5627 RepID=A0A1C7MDE7_GRIFR|nr:hypothetical protein A0H81_05610 [Grifola frondosa]